MFVTESEDRQMALKPMNCPGHCQLYSMQPHSYRDLPVRYSEPGLLHRNEPSGTLHGLLRVRHFAQDDAHIFCTEDQIQDEVAGVLQFAFDTYKLFGLDVRLELSTRPDKRIGSDELWDKSEAALKNALDEPRPRVHDQRGRRRLLRAEDRHPHDRLARPLAGSSAPASSTTTSRSASSLTYTGADNAEHQPVMIHRALMGSYERFIGILLEHFGGELPLWLAPLQVIVLPIADRHNDYAASVRERARRAPACASSSTTAPSRSGARSATPRCARSRSCWSSATASRRRARSACASTARATPARSRVDDVRGPDHGPDRDSDV